MTPSSDLQGCATGVSPQERHCPDAPAYLSSLLRTLASCGHGLWMLLGLALALGVYRHGRSEALVPLALGALFVTAGLLAASLRLPGLAEWHGWRPARRSRPGREALVALAAYLPMLAVAGLVRGDNAFWATRAAAAALAVCSLAGLAYSAHRYRQRLATPASRRCAQLAPSRLVGAWYGGGLWLWLCLATQDGRVDPDITRPWIMALLGLGLLLGLLEGLRWQALGPSGGLTVDRTHGRMERFIAALFTYAIPSVALLVVDLSDAGVAMVALAAAGCLVGRTIERHAYETTLAQLCRDEALA